MTSMARLLFLVLIALASIYAIAALPPKSPSGNAGKVCAPVKCSKPKTCPYGYQKKDGCEICRCNDPCNPPGKAVLCPAGQRCFIDKKSDGTFGTRCDSASKKEKGNKGQKGVQGNSKAICHLPAFVGPCEALMPRFFYNPATKSCESFGFGGCQANANNFQTKAACEAACKA